MERVLDKFGIPASFDFPHYKSILAGNAASTYSSSNLTLGKPDFGAKKRGIWNRIE
jgi:hypothetical protein